jgi:hypothetical protein
MDGVVGDGENEGGDVHGSPGLKTQPTDLLMMLRQKKSPRSAENRGRVEMVDSANE